MLLFTGGEGGTAQDERRQAKGAGPQASGLLRLREASVRNALREHKEILRGRAELFAV